MRLKCEIHYGGADPVAAFAMLCRPQFHERRCAATGAIDHHVEVSTTPDGGLRVATRRRLPTDRVPEFVRGFVGATLTVSQVDTWDPAAADGSRQGTIVVEISGAPVRMTGTLRLTADAGSTPDAANATQYLDGDLKASVPLIGGKIEKAVLPAIEAAIQVEQQVSTAWLREHPRP